MDKIALYPGTFDPITYGHTDLIVRMSNLYDRVVVAIAANPRKTPSLALEQRIELARKVSADFNNVEICGFDGLTVNFAREKGAHVIVRGIRSGSDFDYEMQLAGMNRMMALDIETVFLTPAPQYSAISSTVVREVMAFGGDVSAFVHPLVEETLRSHATA